MANPAGELRGLRDEDRVRLTHRAPGAPYETTVQATVRGTHDGTTVRFHQERMRDADERERQRAHWSAVMDQLAEALAGTG